MTAWCEGAGAADAAVHGTGEGDAGAAPCARVQGESPTKHGFRPLPVAARRL